MIPMVSPAINPVKLFVTPRRKTQAADNYTSAPPIVLPLHIAIIISMGSVINTAERSITVISETLIPI